MTKEEFTNTLKELGLSKKEFAGLSNMAYMSINNWSDPARPVPGWVDSWLINYKKAKAFDDLVALIEKNK